MIEWGGVDGASGFVVSEVGGGKAQGQPKW